MRLDETTRNEESQANGRSRAMDVPVGGMALDQRIEDLGLLPLRHRDAEMVDFDDRLVAVRRHAHAEDFRLRRGSAEARDTVMRHAPVLRDDRRVEQRTRLRASSSVCFVA